MALADFKPQYESITFQGGSFQVRGLALDDVMILMQHYLKDLDTLFALYEEGVREELAVTGTAHYMLKLVEQAPGLVASVIALASDEPDQTELAARLPITVQLDAMIKVCNLTFNEAGGAKKFFENLATMMAGIRPPVDSTGSPN